MVVFHLAASLWVVVDPDHLTAIRQARTTTAEVESFDYLGAGGSQAMASMGSSGMGA